MYLSINGIVQHSPACPTGTICVLLVKNYIWITLSCNIQRLSDLRIYWTGSFLGERKIRMFRLWSSSKVRLLGSIRQQVNLYLDKIISSVFLKYQFYQFKNTAFTTNETSALTSILSTAGFKDTSSGAGGWCCMLSNKGGEFEFNTLPNHSGLWTGNHYASFIRSQLATPCRVQSPSLSAQTAFSTNDN